MPQKLPCGIEFMRGILLLLNIIFVLIALGLIGLGIYIKIDTNFASVLSKLTDVSDFKGQSLGFLAFIMIGGGVITLVIALAGCVGSVWHNRCLLYMYASILILLMILEFVGLIMAFAYKNKLEDVYKTSLTKVFTDALDKNDTKVLNAFHDVENSLKCCGINGRNDYLDHFKDPPPLCYQPEVKGCSSVIIDLLEKNLPIIGSSLGAVLLFELVGLIFAIVLARALKNSEEQTFSSSPGELLSNLVPGRRRNYRKF